MDSTHFWKNYRENITIKDLPDKLKCAVCKSLLSEPYFLSCNHNYCLQCKNQLLLENEKICKICEEEVDGFFLYRIIIEKLKKINITCLNSNECIWKGNIYDFENHSNQCEFISVVCECKLNIIRKDIIFHKSNLCVEREVKCEYCGMMMKNINQTNHLNQECNEVPVKCPNDCQTNGVITIINRKNLDTHLRICPYDNITCEICNLFIKRYQIEKHVKENLYSHVFKLKNEIIQNRDDIDSLKEISIKLIQFSQLKEEITELKQNFHEEINKLKQNFIEEINSKNLELMENKEEISNLKESVKNLENDNNFKLKELQKLREEKLITNEDINKRINNLIKTNSFAEKITLDNEFPVYGFLLFSEDLLISGSKRDIKFWNPNEYNMIDLIPNAHTSNILVLKKLNEDKLISGSTDKSIKIWNVKSKQNVFLFKKEHSLGVLDLLVLSNKRIASASFDNYIKIWDEKSYVSIGTLIGHQNYVSSLIEMNEDEIISCSYDKTIKFWNLQTKNNNKTIQAHTDEILSLVKINNSKFASGALDVKIWGYPNGNCLHTFQLHTDWVQNLILVDKNIIASGSNDKSIKVWNVSTGEINNSLLGHTSHVNKLVQLKESDFASGGKDGKIIIWRNYKKIK